MSIPLKIFRDTFTKKVSIGEFLAEGIKLCETLEDVARAEGVKIKHETCLAPGVYKVRITYSNGFKRDMPLIYNQPDYTVDSGGIKFSGIRIHGGNTEKNTSGCPLVAYNRFSESISGTAEKEVTAKIKQLIEKSDEDFVYLEIVNKKYNA